MNTEELKQFILAIGSTNYAQNRLTMVPADPTNHLEKCLRDVVVRGIEGDFAETGVWRGGLCMLAKQVFNELNQNRKVFVIDSFEGLPQPDPKYPADNGDIHHTYKELAVSLDEVKENFRQAGLLDDKVIFIKGWFKDTLPGPIEKLAILRLDGDMYSSTIEVLETLYSKLSVGGYCIIDDYFLHLGCQKAVNDFRAKEGITSEIIKVCPNTNDEVHYWIK